MRHKIGGFLLLFLATLMLRASAFAEQVDSQSPSTVSPTQGGFVQRAPLPILYRHFLAYQIHLDRAADALEKRGKNGNDFRNHFQKKLDLTGDEIALVRASGLRLEIALGKKDAEAKALIDATRAQFPKQSAKTGQPIELPPVPPQLLVLQKERDQLIEAEVKDLKTKLGSTAAARLDKFLQTDFAPAVTTQSIVLPRTHDPVAQPVPPFRQEVVR
ncbi:hypothetical protein [Granulicella sp. dw_53]|uniref:hypothetical protein n=1 Tax=Granulicella sp. dw_53 TaxID=2719792 RepID=UPI001BD64D00|nr:hypothetical protein [Granulicella sp. dw_53]